MLILDRADPRARKVIRDKETLHKAKGVTTPKIHTILNVYAPNNSISRLTVHPHP